MAFEKAFDGDTKAAPTVPAAEGARRISSDSSSAIWPFGPMMRAFTTSPTLNGRSVVNAMPPALRSVDCSESSVPLSTDRDFSTNPRTPTLTATRLPPRRLACFSGESARPRRSRPASASAPVFDGTTWVFAVSQS